MFKKLCFLIFFVLLLSLATTTYGDVILGDFERSLDGVRPDQSTEADLSFSNKGATLHDYSLQVMDNPDFFWAIQVPLENIDPNIVRNNTHVVYDVVWYDTDWVDLGRSWAKSEKIAFMVEGVWQEVGEDDNYDVALSEVGADKLGWTLETWPDAADGNTLTETIAWNYAADPDIDFNDLEDPPVQFYIVIPTNSQSPGGPFYIDNVMLINGNLACIPRPRDTQTDVPMDTDLRWKGVNAQYYDIYFGTSYDQVDTADTSGGPGDDKVYRSHQDSSNTTYDIPETLEIGSTYYWRVDKDTSKGEIWSFETQGKAREPYPADYATEVERTLLLSWRPGFPGAYHDVYFGTDYNDVNDANITTPIIYRLRQEPNDSNYAVPEYLGIEVTYYWRIDEINNPIYTGDVWRFTTLSAKAKNPYPADGAEGIYIHAIKLAWLPGPYAADALGHDVYLGTDYNDVLNANDNDTTGIFRGHQTETEYPLSNLDLETTYYWRIDEVNAAHPDVNWPGNIWSFTIPDYITIDDFEYYTVSDTAGTSTCPYYDSNDLRLDLNNDMRFWWLDGHVQKNPQGDCGTSTAAYNPLALEASVGRLPGSRIIRTSDGQSGYGMSYFYDNNDVNNADFPPEQAATENKYSEVLRYYANAIDLTPSQINANMAAIELNFQGWARNDCTPVYDRMYVGLRDINNKFAYIDHPNPNAARIGTWQQWAVKLSDFTTKTPTLDLNQIRSIRIGFGKQGNKYNVPVEQQGGEGTVIFDDIRLFEQRCVRGNGPVGDISGPGYIQDCDVNGWDLEIMGLDWLRADQTLTFDTVTAPPAPVLWYEFEETDGNTVADSGTGGYTGTVRNPLKYTWDSAGHNGGCINLLGGRAGQQGTFIQVPPEALNFVSTTHKMSVAVWVKTDSDNPQDNWNGIFGARTALGIDVMEVHCPTPLPPDQPGGPIVEWRVNGSIFCQANMRHGDFAGQWHHYVFAKDADADVMQIYHNGQLAVEVLDVNSAADPFFDTPVGRFYIGCRESRVDPQGDWSWGWYTGRLDDFRVYNKLLSPEEVAYLATDGDGTLNVPLVQAVEPSNLYTTGSPQIINFKDYAKLAENWLEEELWP